MKARKRGKNIYLLIICALDINVLLFYCAFLSIHLPSYPFFLACHFYSQVMWKKNHTLNLLRCILCSFLLQVPYRLLPVIIEWNRATTATTTSILNSKHFQKKNKIVLLLLPWKLLRDDAHALIC